MNVIKVGQVDNVDRLTPIRVRETRQQLLITSTSMTMALSDLDSMFPVYFAQYHRACYSRLKSVSLPSRRCSYSCWMSRLDSLL